MAKETFTAKQREIVARKMGYDGPMQMFDEYLASSPADAQRFAGITTKYMAKGGMVKGYREGGDVFGFPEPSTGTYVAQGREGGYYIPAPVAATPAPVAETPAPAPAPAPVAPTPPTPVPSTPAPAPSQPVAPPLVPVAPTAGTLTAETTDITPGMTVEYTPDTTLTTAAPVAAVAPTAITTPAPITAEAIAPSTSTGAITTELDKVAAEQGAVSEAAKATAATVEPTKTAVGAIQAAQGEAGVVAPIAARIAQEGELVKGTGVDMAKAEETLTKTQAAQGVVTEEMTTQGQLNKLLTDFDAGKPPPWAASTMRAATAQMAARGLGASSMAGQAIVQAALEAAAPIAQADAKVFEQMGLQNLSNRQQTAILLGQQRAAFLGQEFDQTFQAKVLNAAKISDIANKNFDATVTVALENARLTSTMDIANLSARNAMVLATAAQTANLETANLNNRQQVAVENAKAFLAMDVKNLEARQQTTLFKAQQISASILSDTSAENAAKATNATNKLDADKVNASLALTADQFNSAERNKVSIANANAANELVKFNAEQANQRENFNATMTAQININNAKNLIDISTANTAAINAANAVNAKNATDLSASNYAQQNLIYKDLLEMSWNSGENEKQRATAIAQTTITANATLASAGKAADAESSGFLGTLAGIVFGPAVSAVVDKYIKQYTHMQHIKSYLNKIETILSQRANKSAKKAKPSGGFATQTEKAPAMKKEAIDIVADYIEGIREARDSIMKARK